MRLLSFCLALLVCCAGAKADVFVGGGFPLADATETAFGVSFGDIVISGDSRTVATINSVTLTDFSHTFMGDLTIALLHLESGPDAVAILTSPPFQQSANFNGNYTFVVDPSIQTVDEAALGFETTDDLASGTYAMSDFGITEPGPRTDFSALAGVPLSGTWQLLFIDFGQGNTGAVGGWSMNVSAVPEPSGLVVMAVGCACGSVRRKRLPS